MGHFATVGGAPMISLFYRLLAGAALGIAVALPSAAAPFSYLIDAANKIKEIEYSKTVLSRDDNGRIVKIACDALTRLVEDGDFKNALSDILSKSKTDKASALLEKLSDFNKDFLQVELDNLVRAGLDYPVDALQIATRERTKANVKNISAIDVMKDVQTAKDSVCRMAASAVTEQQRKAAQWTFGGVTLIVVDVVAALGVGAVSGGALAVASEAVLVSSIGVGAAAAVSGSRGEIP